MDLLNCPGFFLLHSFFLLLVLVVSGWTANGITNLADVSCGKQLSRKPKVVGGNDTFQGEFPWIVSIKEKSSAGVESTATLTHVCGGSILNSRYILSAAHCFEKFYLSRRRTVVGVDRLFVTVGEHDLTQEESPMNAISIGVERLIVNPDFDIFGYMNDVVLLRLDRDIQWTPYSWPACLPDQDYDEMGTEMRENATVAGWGSRVDITGDEDHDVPEILQKVNVPIISNKECNDWFHQNGIQWTPTESHLCAGYPEGGKDACRGDSGGPLMVQSQNEMGDSVAVIVGVVAAGKGCARPYLPGVYTRVGKYLTWIKETIQD